VLASNDDDWELDHWKSIEHNYHRAECFKEHEAFFKELYNRKWERLMDISVATINYALNCLEIKTPIKLSSSYNLNTTSTERIIDLCKKTGADTYLSGAGGRDYMDLSLFEKNGIKLLFQDFKHPQYTQLYGGFEPYMSFIDLVMNCGAKSRDVLFQENI
jgi:hypothetical protein